MTIRNPKLDGSNCFDCIPQIGPCSIGCNQCFYNRPGAFYVPIDQPHIPSPEEVGDGIVRMNCGNDSNNQRDLVIATAKQYKHVFFNTSIPRFDFPGPVVLTANPCEEDNGYIGIGEIPPNLMFVRLRVSATNLPQIDNEVEWWTRAQVPVVLTFMAYYDEKPQVDEEVVGLESEDCYEWKVRHINSYHCPTSVFIHQVRKRYEDVRLVSVCGGFCRDCHICETYYWQTLKRLQETGE